MGEYSLGDMLWARVSGHPWWPCNVAPDPTLDIYLKKNSKLFSLLYISTSIVWMHINYCFSYSSFWEIT